MSPVWIGLPFFLASLGIWGWVWHMARHEDRRLLRGGKVGRVLVFQERVGKKHGPR